MSNPQIPYAIDIADLSRVYKSYDKPEGIWESIRGFWDRKYKEKVALKPTNLKIQRGQIVGLVGANGAGKTTLLKMLSGLIHPSSGKASVLGYSPWERKSEFLKKMSVLLGQKNQLWWDISANDSYALLAEIYDIPIEISRKRVLELATLLNCTHVLDTQLRRLSLGERMKMEIIGALLHEPEVLFLDEPTIGLDVVAQTTIREFLNEYVKRKQPTVILTSHYMDDIAKLADRLLLISQGSIVYDGTVDDFILKAERKQSLHFSLTSPLEQNLKISNELELKAGEQSYSVQLTQKELPQALSKVTGLVGVQDLKIEEADFEEIIHSFLEKESRI